MRSSEKGKPDLFDKQLSGTANLRFRNLALDPGSKVSKESSYVDLLVVAQLEVVQSEGSWLFHGSFSARVYRRLKAASCLIAVDVTDPQFAVAQRHKSGPWPFPERCE